VRLKTSVFEKQNLILGLLAIILSQTHHYSTTAFYREICHPDKKTRQRALQRV